MTVPEMLRPGAEDEIHGRVLGRVHVAAGLEIIRVVRRHGDAALGKTVELVAAVGVRSRRAAGAARPPSARPPLPSRPPRLSAGCQRDGGVGHRRASRVGRPGRKARLRVFNERTTPSFVSPSPTSTPEVSAGAVARGRAADRPLPGRHVGQLEGPVVGLERLVSAAARPMAIWNPPPPPRAPLREIVKSVIGFLASRVLDAPANRPGGLQHDREVRGRRRDVLLRGWRSPAPRRSGGSTARRRTRPAGTCRRASGRAVLRPPAASHVDAEDLRAGDRRSGASRTLPAIGSARR